MGDGKLDDMSGRGTGVGDVVHRRVSAALGDLRQKRTDSAADPLIDQLIDAATDLPLLKAMLRISDAVLSSDYFDEVLEVIAEQAQVSLGAASVSISRWERPSDTIRTLINVGQLAPIEERWPSDECYDLGEHQDVAELLHEGRSYIHCVDEQACPPSSREVLLALGKDSELAVPIMVGDSMWGEIWASHTAGHSFVHSDAQLLQAIAAYASIAIGRSELLSAVWGYAYEDPLTEIANRRAADRFCGEIDWDETGVVAMVCDLDGFKMVNDQDGHPAGDRLLCDVAGVLAGLADADDRVFVARLGGDEFCVLMCDSTLPEAQAFAKAATREILDITDNLAGVSWGAADSRDLEVRTADALLAAADAALLEAKRHGPAHFSSVVLTDGLPADGDGRMGGRRRGTAELADSVVRIMAQNPRLSALEALEVLVLQLQRSIGICAYAISYVTADGSAVVTTRKMDITAEPDSGLAILTDLGVAGGDLKDYPETERAVSEGSYFLAAETLAGSDPAEVDLLRVLGYGAVLGIGVHGPEHRYLVEFYSNDGHESLQAAASLIQVLAYYCVARRRGNE